MAAKKTTKTDKPAAKATKSVKADKPVSPVTASPAVDLSHAAGLAAKLLANGRKQVEAAGDAGKVSTGKAAGGGAINAAVFNQLKAGLGQTQHAPTSPLAGLNKTAKPAGASGFGKQAGHHQTLGSNVARTGVPRRTSGG